MNANEEITEESKKGKKKRKKSKEKVLLRIQNRNIIKTSKRKENEKIHQ